MAGRIPDTRPGTPNHEVFQNRTITKDGIAVSGRSAMRYQRIVEAMRTVEVNGQVGIGDMTFDVLPTPAFDTLADHHKAIIGKEAGQWVRVKNNAGHLGDFWPYLRLPVSPQPLAAEIRLCLLRLC